MLNQVVLVGRLVRDVVVTKTDAGKKIANITLAIPRSFKNYDGVYDTDFIDCTLWDTVACNTSQYCKKGDIVGIRGRLQSRTITNGDEKRHVVDVIAEKVTFLSGKKKDEESE